jgi:hypothetical protein
MRKDKERRMKVERRRKTNKRGRFMAKRENRANPQMQHATAFQFLSNCHRPDLANPARLAFLAGNDDAEWPLPWRQRLAILGVG